jgi:putative transposase
MILPYEIHLLEFASTEQQIQGLLSLTPAEATSVAISKTKGRISKWLSDRISDPKNVQKLLATGYFAVTVGQSNAAAVDQYLKEQSEHHGYVDRARPPVFVRSISHSDEAIRKLQTDHAVTMLRYHLVFAVPFRRGVFTADLAGEVTNRWIEVQDLFSIDKVSFLPDHVHIAVSVHPKVSPAVVVCELMNSSQEFMWQQFSNLIVKAGVERLWQPSAYIGSFGDLSSNAVSAYMRRWSQSIDD